jgi:hypothetical protein
MTIRKYSLRQISDLFVQIDEFDIDVESGDFYMDDVSILQINKINVIALTSTDMKRNTRISGFTFMLNYCANVSFLKYTTTNELNEKEISEGGIKIGDKMVNEIPNEFEFDGNKTDFETFMQLSLQLINKI